MLADGQRRQEDAGAALHGPRLRSLQEKLVDSPARGLVYESAGSVDDDLLATASTVVSRWARRSGCPWAVGDEDPADVDAWAAAMRRGVARILGLESAARDPEDRDQRSSGS